MVPDVHKKGGVERGFCLKLVVSVTERERERGVKTQPDSKRDGDVTIICPSHRPVFRSLDLV